MNNSNNVSSITWSRQETTASFAGKTLEKDSINQIIVYTNGLSNFINYPKDVSNAALNQRKTTLDKQILEKEAELLKLREELATVQDLLG